MKTIIITKKHCINADYTNNLDCPLARALKEKLPFWQKPSVGGEDFTIHYFGIFKGKTYTFDHSTKSGWCSSRVEEIENGQIQEYKLTYQ